MRPVFNGGAPPFRIIKTVVPLTYAWYLHLSSSSSLSYSSSSSPRRFMPDFADIFPPARLAALSAADRVEQYHLFLDAALRTTVAARCGVPMLVAVPGGFSVCSVAPRVGCMPADTKVRVGLDARGAPHLHGVGLRRFFGPSALSYLTVPFQHTSPPFHPFTCADDAAGGQHSLLRDAEPPPGRARVPCMHG